MSEYLWAAAQLTLAVLIEFGIAVFALAVLVLVAVVSVGVHYFSK